MSRYQQKISGPFLDRMDLVLALTPCANESEQEVRPEPGESSQSIRERILQARERQEKRLKGYPWTRNAEIPALKGLLDELCPLHDKALALLECAASREGLSLRAQQRIHKVAQSLCDLRPELQRDQKVGESALALALQLRKPLRSL